MKFIPIEISARHCHLCKADLKVLFGEGYELTKDRDISQKGQYSCKETVNIKSEAAEIKNLRIVGPLRDASQAEISKTDAYSLKIDPPIKECTSCVGEEAENIKIIGPKGEIEKKIAIIPHRHIHMDEEDAKNLGVKNGEMVSVKTSGDRALVFKSVLVRVDPSFVLSMQIDTDEGNAAGIKTGETGELIKNE